MGKISQELLDDLRCPRSHAPLLQHGDWLYVNDPQARLKYPIRNGIPVLLGDAAVEVDQAEFDQVVGASQPQENKKESHGTA